MGELHKAPRVTADSSLPPEQEDQSQAVHTDFTELDSHKCAHHQQLFVKDALLIVASKGLQVKQLRDAEMYSLQLFQSVTNTHQCDK